MARSPLQGLYVQEHSTGLAGRLTGLLLADQGATVTICRGDRPADPLDAYLDRGKLRHTGPEPLPSYHAAVIIKDGLFSGERPHGQIRLAVTAVLPGETDYPFADDTGDDMLKAVSGFYTDIAVTRNNLGDEVTYTPLPMCSVYAGVLGATAVGAALAERARHAAGRDIVMSRLAAGLSAVGAMVLEVDGLPHHLKPSSATALPAGLATHVPQARRDVAHAEWLKRQANPFFACYPTSDHRTVMFASLAHRGQARGLLDQLGLWETLQGDGMVDASPYDPANASVADRNVAAPQGLRLDLRMKAADLIEQAVKRRTALEWERRLSAAGIPCVVVRGFDEWRGLDQTLQAGLTEMVPGCDWPQLGRAVRLASAKPYPALRLASEALSEPPADLAGRHGPPPNAPLHGVRVLDLANVIAGPACGRILAELGADVIKVDTARPQFVPLVTAVWHGELSQGKRSILLDLGQQAGRQVLSRLVGNADIIVFNKLDPVLERLGLDRASLARLNPKAIAVQVSAFKGERPGERDNDPGYDPNLQAATGIMSRFGSLEAPELHGLASCVDYLTGYLASFGAVIALTAQARRADGTGDWVDTSLANAASLIQLPFQVEPAPVGDALCLRKLKDGWVCVEPPDTQLAPGSTVAEAIATASKAGAVAVQVQSLAQLKQRHRGKPGVTVAFRKTAGAYPTLNLAPSWFHFDGAPLAPTAPPTPPGADAQDILAAQGYSPAEVAELVADGVVGRAFWAACTDTPQAASLPQSKVGAEQAVGMGGS